MQNDFLKPILSEADLEPYETYINSPDFKKEKNESFLDFLKSLVGKNIKIYITVGNQLIALQGKLTGIFNDYVTIYRNREKLAIKLTEIKFISIS